MRLMTTVDAAREAHELILAENEHNIIIGEGVPDPKACFGTTRDLDKKFGKQVFDMPVSENGMTGICIGAALNGIKPMLIHMRQDFMLYAFDQIVNNAAKWNSMFGGKGGNVPIVMKAFTGRGWGSGHQHSQNLESLFAHIPGLKVLIPSSPRNAKGLLIAAHQDPNPCIILEDRWIHHLEGDVPEGWYKTPIDTPEVVREGDDGTIICWGQLVGEAVRAADYLSRGGVKIRVIDLVTLSVESCRRAARMVHDYENCFIFQNAWDSGAYAHTVATHLPGSCPITVPNIYPSSSPSLIKDYYHTASRMVRIWGDPKNFPAAEFHDIPDKTFKGPF